MPQPDKSYIFHAPNGSTFASFLGPLGTQLVYGHSLAPVDHASLDSSLVRGAVGQLRRLSSTAAGPSLAAAIRRAADRQRNLETRAERIALLHRIAGLGAKVSTYDPLLRAPEVIAAIAEVREMLASLEAAPVAPAPVSIGQWQGQTLHELDSKIAALADRLAALEGTPS